MIPLLSRETVGMSISEFFGRCWGCGEETDWNDGAFYECQRCKSIVMFLNRKQQEVAKRTYYTTTFDSLTRYNNLPKRPQPAMHYDPTNGRFFACTNCSLQEDGKCSASSDGSGVIPWMNSTAPPEQRILVYTLPYRLRFAVHFGIKYELPCECNRCHLGKAQ